MRKLRLPDEPRASTPLIKSLPTQIVIPSAPEKNNPNHSFVTRSAGQIVTPETIPETNIENQIACAETNALAGGSQPPASSKSLHSPGIGIR